MEFLYRIFQSPSPKQTAFLLLGHTENLAVDVVEGV